MYDHSLRIFSDIIDLLAGYNFDTLALSETWLHEGILFSCHIIPSYTLLRVDRQSDLLHRGGDIAVYIKSSIRFDVVCDRVPAIYNCALDISGILLMLNRTRVLFFARTYISPSKLPHPAS